MDSDKQVKIQSVENAQEKAALSAIADVGSIVKSPHGLWTFANFVEAVRDQNQRLSTAENAVNQIGQFILSHGNKEMSWGTSTVVTRTKAKFDALDRGVEATYGQS